MAIHTPFTRSFSVAHPIALAPMGSVAGGRLAAAVSNGGGLGLVGGGRGDETWLEREVTIVSNSTDKPWGVGFLAWSISPRTIERAMRYQPRAVLLSFGDLHPFAAVVREGGAKLLVQVTDLDEARRAVDVGADLIVAQGSEAGGHGGGRATLPFVPAVVDRVSPTPVLAAGGVADGRGIAAALALGATGALIGTRFEATPEALLSADERSMVIEGAGEDTERSRILDIARDSPWPAKYPARTLRNNFLDTWRHREDQLHDDPEARVAYQQAIAHGDRDALPVWAGEALDLVDEITPAAELVSSLAAQADAVLAAIRGLAGADETAS